MSALDLDRTLAMIDKHRGLIKGVKVRASRQVVGDMDMLPVCFAKQAAALLDSKGVPRPITRLFALRWAILGDKLVRAGRRELPAHYIKE